MAGVTINIPNIGNVVADNAASEETLQKILAAMQKQGTGAGGGDAKKKQADKDALKATEEQTKAQKEANEEQDKAIKQAKEGTAGQKAANLALKTLSGAWNGVSTGFAQGIGVVKNTLGVLASSAISVATQMMTSYDSMAKDPIGAAKGLLNTGIDAVAGAATGIANAVGNTARAFSGIPVVGPLIAGLGSAAAEAAKAVISLAATLLKTANEVFAAEFKKSTAALSSYTKAGASFAGGMTEMRNVANKAGLSLDTLNKATLASSEAIRASGLTMGDGAHMIAKGMDAARSTIGKSGMSMRDEMLALGFGYEEQGEIVASLSAQMKASGVDIRNLAPAELARQTKDYATNLKVMSDITGQDARKLMDKARAESMRGSLMNKLDKDQRDNFTKAHTMLSKYGPEVQNALIQQIAGGTITDAKVAANADLVQMIQEIAGNVQQAGGDIVETTGKSMGEARQRLEQSSVAGATDLATALGSTGLPAAMAGITNNILSSGFTPEMAAQSKAAAESQSVNIDEAGKNFAKLTSQANDFAVKMEQMVGQNLDTYSKMLADTYTKTAEVMTKVIAGVDKLLETVNNPDKVMKKMEDENKGKMVGVAGGAATGAILGSIIPGIGTAVGAAVGGVVGGLAGWYAGDQYDQQKAAEAAEREKEKGTVRKAKGGIVAGPTGGYDNVELHGVEAVVPLPDGNKIPVSMDLGDAMGSAMSPMSNALKSVQSKLDKQSEDGNVSAVLGGLEAPFSSLMKLPGGLEKSMSEVSAKLATPMEKMAKESGLIDSMSNITRSFDKKPTVEMPTDWASDMVTKLSDKLDVSNASIKAALQDWKSGNFGTKDTGVDSMIAGSADFIKSQTDKISKLATQVTTDPMQMFDQMKSVFTEPLSKLTNNLDLKTLVGDYAADDKTKKLIEEGKAQTDNIMKEMSGMMQQMTETVKQQNANSPMGDMVKHLEDLKNTANKQLDVHGTMSKLLGDHKDLAQSLLNNSY